MSIAVNSLVGLTRFNHLCGEGRTKLVFGGRLRPDLDLKRTGTDRVGNDLKGQAVEKRIQNGGKLPVLRPKQLINEALAHAGVDGRSFLAPIPIRLYATPLEQSTEQHLGPGRWQGETEFFHGAGVIQRLGLRAKLAPTFFDLAR